MANLQWLEAIKTSQMYHKTSHTSMKNKEKPI